jgi:galactokinase
VSLPELDLLVSLADTEADVYGARLCGAGFGGAVVLLCRRGRGLPAVRRIADVYAERSGRRPTVLLPLAPRKESDRPERDVEEGK